MLFCPRGFGTNSVVVNCYAIAVYLLIALIRSFIIMHTTLHYAWIACVFCFIILFLDFMHVRGGMKSCPPYEKCWWEWHIAEVLFVHPEHRRSCASMHPRHTVHPEHRRSCASMHSRHTVHPEHKKTLISLLTWGLRDYLLIPFSCVLLGFRPMMYQNILFTSPLLKSLWTCSYYSDWLANGYSPY